MERPGEGGSEVPCRGSLEWSLDAPAFNGNANAGIAPNRSYAVIGAADLIVHF